LTNFDISANHWFQNYTAFSYYSWVNIVIDYCDVWLFYLNIPLFNLIWIMLYQIRDIINCRSKSFVLLQVLRFLILIQNLLPFKICFHIQLCWIYSHANILWIHRIDITHYFDLLFTFSLIVVQQIIKSWSSVF